VIGGSSARPVVRRRVRHGATGVGENLSFLEWSRLRWAGGRWGALRAAGVRCATATIVVEARAAAEAPAREITAKETAMADYLPPRDVEFDQWVAHFDGLLTEHGSTYDISSDEQAALRNLVTQWSSDYALHIGRRHAARAARAAKDANRRLLREMVRSIVRRLQVHPEMTDAMRQSLGITVPGELAVSNLGVLPVTRPLATIDTSHRLRHRIDFTDEQTPTSRRRPRGIGACEIWTKLGGEAPADESQLTFVSAATRSRHVIDYTADQAGQVVHYMLRWVSTRGQKGPWSLTASATVVA
jgi:hypothetical protein